MWNLDATPVDDDDVDDGVVNVDGNDDTSNTNGSNNTTDTDFVDSSIVIATDYRDFVANGVGFEEEDPDNGTLDPEVSNVGPGNGSAAGAHPRRGVAHAVGGVTCISVCLDESRLLSGGGDCVVKLWSMHLGSTENEKSDDAAHPRDVWGVGGEDGTDRNQGDGMHGNDVGGVCSGVPAVDLPQLLRVFDECFTGESKRRRAL